MSDPSHTAGSEGMPEGRSPRFTQWIALVVFSTVTLGSSVELRNASSMATTSDQRWAIFCSGVACMHLHPLTSIFVVGTIAEGILILILSVFWSATVAVVSDAGRGLAVSADGAVSNGNLYYFSWAGFVCTIMLIVSFLRSVYGVDVPGEIKSRSARLTLWSARLASALIVMGSCAKILGDECDVSDDKMFCRRTKFGLSVGVIGVVFSLSVVGLKIATSSAPFVAEGAAAIFLAVMDGFGVAYITSAKGPGSPLGNLYYFTWISFVGSLMLTASCVQDYQAAQQNDPTVPSGNPNVHMDNLEVPDV
eukprot:CAMPEP_0118699546 /NCGR_PEP_ID=MMETSP0800-20121206/15966_1 /TAXON_ID=210618 ORGANISM="Striatella unipunctata, Strain CCMP2910" /NCGR_SAMPLE_ID=MMETSP0800 /ASSEMBLY_ACC=CAM_ASM_000638 /LENGTH=306 /DNA_ID=CAMNT_0006599789 /DNA_START=92 /DNA_END=1012 /DNA_ORIENTATION=-